MDLTFSRGSFRLHAHATLGPGVTGVLGRSGAGKSTLLGLLAGLLKPDLGTLYFNNELLNDAARDIAVPAWKRHFGVVFQEGRLFPHLSVRRNLLYGAQRLPELQRRVTLDKVTQLLELAPLLSRRPLQLSGGERQRVALGRALLYSPRLLLLDEPLAALDERLRQQILPFLKRIKEEIRIPMLYVSHEQREIDFLSDRVVRIHEGELTL